MKNTDYESQLSKVKRKLIKDGFVSRNWCLERYISRLSSIIYILKDKGWAFRTEGKRGERGDFLYFVEQIGL